MAEHAGKGTRSTGMLAARFEELPIAERVALLQSELLMEEFRRNVLS
jgi:hypothetical protein